MLKGLCKITQVDSSGAEIWTYAWLVIIMLDSNPYSFSSSHIQMQEVDHKEGWMPKNWRFQTGAGEDSWESLGLKGEKASQS